jgi:hypothetical protein
LVDHFGNAQACFTAPTEDLRWLPGIGLETAAAIRDVDGANAAVPEERRNCPRAGTPISLPGSSSRVGILTRTGEPSSVLKKEKHIVILYYTSA